MAKYSIFITAYNIALSQYSKAIRSFAIKKLTDSEIILSGKEYVKCIIQLLCFNVVVSNVKKRLQNL